MRSSISRAAICCAASKRIRPAAITCTAATKPPGSSPRASSNGASARPRSCAASRSISKNSTAAATTPPATASSAASSSTPSKTPRCAPTSRAGIATRSYARRTSWRWSGGRRTKSELLLAHHHPIPFEPDLEAGHAFGFDHHVFEGLVVDDGGDEVAGPGDEGVGGDRERVFARDAERERLDRRGDRERDFVADFDGVDLALVGRVVDRLDAVRQRVFEREEVAAFDVDEFVVEVEEERLAAFLVDEDFPLAHCFDERLRGNGFLEINFARSVHAKSAHRSGCSGG